MHTDQVFDQLNSLNARLRTLDEQGLVLTLAAFADDSLGELLSAYMFQNSASRRLINGYDAPLGTFSAKINGAFALGLITEGQYQDLQHLRKVRNMFSHTWAPIAYDHKDVAKHIWALSFSNLSIDMPSSLREKIETSISALLLELRVAVSSIKKRRANARTLGSRIYAGLPGDTEENFGICIEKFKEIAKRQPSAVGEEKRFLVHLKKLWIDKCLRVIAHGPKERCEEYILEIQKYVSPDESRFSNLYEGYTE